MTKFKEWFLHFNWNEDSRSSREKSCELAWEASAEQYKDEIDRLKEGLKKYADKNNWIDYSKNGAYLFFKLELPLDFYDENRTSNDPVGGRIAREILGIE
jgi:hypothetical protein